MEFKNIPKETAEQFGLKKRFLHSYSKPNLVRLGSVIDITAGNVGSAPDVTGPTSPPTQKK